MANRLKHMILKSVDLVRRGANPDADIKLYKSADVPETFLKSADEVDAMVEKSLEMAGNNLECLYKSYDSIMNDEELTDSEAREMLAKSLVQFNEAMYADVIKGYSFEREEKAEEPVEKPTMKYSEMLESKNLTDEEKEQLSTLIGKCRGSVLKADEDEEIELDEDPEDDGEEVVIEESAASVEVDEDDEADDIIEESSEEIPEETEVEEAAAAEEQPVEKPEEDEEEPEAVAPIVTKKAVKKNCKVNKSAAYQKLFEKQQETLATLQKRFDMQELTEIAKKYEAIGENPDELAETLYDMKQAGDGIYKSYLNNLDKTLALYEKSSVFGEIGKSFSGNSENDPEGKIEQIAKSYMEANPAMNYIDAKAKAWSDHPELAFEYEQNRRR